MKTAAVLMSLSIWLRAWAPVSWVAPMSMSHPELSDAVREQGPAQVGVGVIAGAIRQGTQSALLPERLEVGLIGVEDSGVVEERLSYTDETGNFSFSNVQVVVGRVYGVYVSYQGVDYFSSGVDLATESSQTDIDLVIYESGASSRDVLAEQVHFLVDLNENQQVQITQVWLLTTAGDRAYKPGAGTPLQIELPDRAMDIEIETPIEGELIEVQDAIAVILPVRPEQLTDVIFRTTHEAGTTEFNFRFSLPAEAAIWLVPEDLLTLTGSGITDAGTAEYAGTLLHQYERKDLTAGDQLTVTFISASEQADTVVILALVGATLMLGGALLFIWNRKRLSGVDEVYVMLTRYIAELDQAFKEGKIDEERYRGQRALLKDQALKRLAKDHD